MTENNEKKYKKAGLGDLPPMVHLAVKDIIEGTIEDVRDVKRKDSKKSKTQIGLHVKLTAGTEVSTGSVKKKTYKRVKFAAGERICVTVGGNLSTLLKDIVLKETGEDLSKVSTDELRAAHLSRVITGRDIRLERMEDGEMSDGDFKGNPVKRFSLDYTDKAAV